MIILNLAVWMHNETTPSFRCRAGPKRIIGQLIDVVAAREQSAHDLSGLLQGVSMREFLAFAANSEHAGFHAVLDVEAGLDARSRSHLVSRKSRVSASLEREVVPSAPTSPAPWRLPGSLGRGGRTIPNPQARVKHDARKQLTRFQPAGWRGAQGRRGRSDRAAAVTAARSTPRLRRQPHYRTFPSHARVFFSPTQGFHRSGFRTAVISEASAGWLVVKRSRGSAAGKVCGEVGTL